MKLLFDNNLSVKLAQFVQDQFPGSAHVFDLKLDKASDRQIFDFARNNEFIIVTKDSDFYHLLNTYGSPPKVIWITLGNSGNAELKEFIFQNMNLFAEFGNSSKSLLVIGK